MAKFTTFGIFCVQNKHKSDSSQNFNDLELQKVRLHGRARWCRKNWTKIATFDMFYVKCPKFRYFLSFFTFFFAITSECYGILKLCLKHWFPCMEIFYKHWFPCKGLSYWLPISRLDSKGWQINMAFIYSHLNEVHK